jgi:serine/threonine-protein kinase
MTPAERSAEQAASAYEVAAIGAAIRLLAVLGPLVTVGFVLFDWLHARYIHPTRLGPLLAVRAAQGAVIALAGAPILRSRLTSRRAALLFFLLAGGATQLADGALSALTNGLGSVYLAGSSFLWLPLAMIGQPWRTSAALAAALMPVCFVATIAFCALRGVPAAPDDASVAFAAVAAVSSSSLAGAAILAADLRHRLLRQLYETRDIGRYELRTRVGRGGMGEVWLAFHRGLQRDVAVKILAPLRARPATSRKRFEREARATSELLHPNTVRVLDYGVTADGRPYYAMELLEGDSLADVIRIQGALPPWRAVRIVKQAAAALSEAHARGIVHRDVKPENLLLTRLGAARDFVKLIDFGVAKLERDHEELTAHDAIAGTPAYMAPEQVRGDVVDARTDVYALGATLYAALTGRPPVAGADVGKLLLAVVEEDVLPPSKRAPGVPPELDAIVLRCLEKRANDRYATAEAVYDALDAWESAGRR